MNVDDEIRKHLHIVLCGDNVNSLGIVRALGEKGIHPLVILVQENHIPLVGRSKYVKKMVKTNSMEESINVLKTYANKDCKPFVYTTDDNHQSLLDEQYEELKDVFCFYRSNVAGNITKYMDKKTLCTLAEECDINVPTCEILKKGERPIINSYPIFIKAINSYSSGWKHDVAICNNEQELMAAYQWMIGNKLLVQPYIEKLGEYSLQGISINDGRDVYAPYAKQYVRFSSTSFGGYMYYEKCTNIDLKRKIQNLLQKIHYNGLFEIEFLVDKKGQLWFLEINFRSSASNYAMNYGGVNLPYMWACAEVNGCIDTSNIQLRADCFYAVNEGTDIQFIRKTGFFKWLRDFVKADSYYLGNMKDPMPALCYWPQWILRKVKKKLKL